MSATQVILISVIVPLVVGCIPAIITYLLGRRSAAVEPDKIRADTASILTGGYEKLVQDYQEQIGGVKAELERVRKLQEETANEYLVMLRQDQGEIESLRGGMRDLETVLNKQTDELRELRKAMTKADVRIAGLERENEGLRKSLTNAEARITELERENEALRERNVALMQELGQSERS